MNDLNPKVANAIRAAVHRAIEELGIEGIRAMSLFPSAQKEQVSYKLAA